MKLRISAKLASVHSEVNVTDLEEKTVFTTKTDPLSALYLRGTTRGGAMKLRISAKLASVHSEVNVTDLEEKTVFTTKTDPLSAPPDISQACLCAQRRECDRSRGKDGVHHQERPAFGASVHASLRCLRRRARALRDHAHRREGPCLFGFDRRRRLLHDQALVPRLQQYLRGDHQGVPDWLDGPHAACVEQPV